MKKILNSVSGKLILATGTAIAGIMIAYTAVNVMNVKSATERDVMALATEKAASVSEKIAGDISVATSAGATLAATIGGFIENGSRSRADIVSMIETVAPQYPNVFGAWMCELIDGKSPKPTGPPSPAPARGAAAGNPRNPRQRTPASHPRRCGGSNPCPACTARSPSSAESRPSPLWPSA